jgi:hypothetical protein
MQIKLCGTLAAEELMLEAVSKAGNALTGK